MNKHFLTLILLAIASGWMLRFQTADMRKITSKALGRLCWIFLSIFSIEHLTSNVFGFRNVVFMLICILIIYFIGIAVHKLMSLNEEFLVVAATTFGGGNRGMALIQALVALPMFYSAKDELISTYLQLDSAVIVWLIAVVPYLLSKKGDAKVSIIDSIKSFVSESGFGPIFVVFVVLFGWLVPSEARDFIADQLKPSEDSRNFILSYLAFLLIYLNSDVKGRTFGELFRDLGVFYAPRLLLVALIFASAYAFSGEKWFGDKLVLAVALVVLMVCPPSSFLSVYASTFEIDEKSIVRIGNINIMATLMFGLVLLLLAVPHGWFKFVYGAAWP